MPPPHAALLALRGSAEYGRRLSREWSLIVFTAAGSLVVAYLVIAATKGATLGDYLIGLALPSLPAVVGAIDTGKRHWRNAKLRSAVVERVDTLWAEAIAGDPVSMTTAREIATFSLAWRAAGPAVPNWYYAIRRQRLERDAKAARKRLETEAQGGRFRVSR